MVHNIITRFREFKDIFVLKGQGHKSILDIEAVRQRCITKRNDSVVKMTACHQEN